MKASRWAWIVVAWAVLIAAAVGLSRVGAYGVSLFAFMPFAMGALTEWSWRAPTTRRALTQGAGTAAVGCLFFIVIGVEGLICMAMALPLAVPLGTVGQLALVQNADDSHQNEHGGPPVAARRTRIGRI